MHIVPKYAVLPNDRINTSNHCIARDITSIGENCVFGYNVHMGLRSGIKLSDVFSVYQFEGNSFQFDPESRNNITGAGSLALAAIMGGASPGDLRWADPDEDFSWVATDNTKVPMDAPTMIAFASAGGTFAKRLIFKARDMKDRIEAGEIVDPTSNVEWL